MRIMSGFYENVKNYIKLQNLGKTIGFWDTHDRFSIIKYENGKYSIVDHAESKVENAVDESVEVAEPVKIDVKKNKKTIKKKLDDVVEE